VHGDALATDWRALVSGIEGPIRICANLPYNVGTALLVNWLESDTWPPWFERMVLMFQREVAERIVATPEQRVDYGRLGVLAGWRTKARILFDVPPSAFSPPPKVTSSIVELTPHAEPLACNGKILSAVTASAFNQRRKMLRQSLKGLAVNGKTLDALALLNAAGITETKRAEEVDVAGFVRLAQIAEEMSR
jgi:16S rRNA (adenine1518-N6/adenine1519-N6)-dimethyltransferase